MNDHLDAVIDLFLSLYLQLSHESSECRTDQ